MSAEQILQALLGGLAPPTPRLKVPGNLVDEIKQTEARTGVPFHIIAGVIQTNYTTGTSGDWPTTINSKIINAVADRLIGAAPLRGPVSEAGWRVRANRQFGGSRPTWLDRFDSIVYARDKAGEPITTKPEWIEREPGRERDRALTRSDYERALKEGLINPSQFESALRGMGYDDEEIALVVGMQGRGGGPTAAEKRLAAPVTPDDIAQLYDNYLGRAPENQGAIEGRLGRSYGQVAMEIQSSPEAAWWRLYGLAITKVKSWVTNAYEKYVGRQPTNAEIKSALDRGYTPQALAQYLASRPIDPSDPTKGTLGQKAGLSSSASQYANQYLGREADPGEVSFMLQNCISTPDQVSAFYEQMQQRQQTGDPAFAWVGNPQQWRDMQTSLASAYKSAGLTEQVDPHLVNQAITEKWGKDQITQMVDAKPAPGFAAGVTVGQVNRIRPIADNWKATWYPSQAATPEELRHFIDGKMDSNQMHDYYGNMPSTTATAPGPKIDLTNPAHGPRQNAQTGTTTQAQPQPLSQPQPPGQGQMQPPGGDQNIRLQRDEG